MTYWGCSTARNRCAWTLCAVFAITATACLCVGAGQMWLCNHRAAGGTQGQQDAGSCRVKAGIVMALCPVAVLLGVLPSLLFFQSCMAEAPPQAVDWEQNVPASGITVVRRTSNGAAVYRYDAHGKLLQAPDCYRHMTRTPPSPAKLYTGPSWLTADYDTQHTSGGGMMSPGRVTFSGPVHNSSAGVHLQPVSSSSSIGGRLQGSNSPRGQYSMAGGQYSPQHRQYSGQGSTQGDEAATAEVYICLSPLTEAAKK